MPFRSRSQARFMFAKHPEMAKRWARETPALRSLPEKKGNDVKHKDHAGMRMLAAKGKARGRKVTDRHRKIAAMFAKTGKK